MLSCTRRMASSRIGLAALGSLTPRTRAALPAFLSLSPQRASGAFLPPPVSSSAPSPPSAPPSPPGGSRGLLLEENDSQAERPVRRPAAASSSPSCPPSDRDRLW